MKCQKCGAEVTGKFCPYCGTSITTEMRQEQEAIDKAGCPQCHSGNIQFKRENHGERTGKGSKTIVHKTVGFCKDCGYTWFPQDLAKQQQQKQKAEKDKYFGLWVIGWLLFFPIPLTVLIVKAKWPKWAKGIAIAALWILVIGIGSTNQNKKEATEKIVTAEAVADPEEVPTAPEPTEEPTPEPTPEPTEGPAEELEAVATDTYAELNSIDESTRLQAYLVLLEMAIAEQFDEYYKITTDEEANLVNITVWRPGVTANSLLSDQSAWDTLRKAAETSCKQWFDAFSEAGLEGYHISMSVANDLNTDRLLLTVLDGVTIYDFLSE